MFQPKIHELSQGLLDVFGIADDILIGGLITWAETTMLHLTSYWGYADRPI